MDIAHLFDFDFPTSAMGMLRICALEDELDKAVRKEVRDTEVDATELATRIFGDVAHRLTGDASIDNVCAGPPVGAYQVKNLEEGELDKFAEQYGARFFGQHDGKGPNAGQPRGVDFLVFQIRESLRLATERTVKLLDSAKLYSSATLEAMARNDEVSDRLSGVIKDYNTHRPVFSSEIFPERLNPIKVTNEVLVQLLEKVEQMRPVFAMCAEIIQSMNSTALQMQSDSAVAAARADKLAARSMRVATIGIYISFVALISSCGFSLWTIIDAKNSAVETDLKTAALRNEIRDATAAANKARADLELAAAEDRKALVRALAKISPPDKRGRPKSKR